MRRLEEKMLERCFELMEGQQVLRNVKDPWLR